MIALIISLSSVKAEVLLSDGLKLSCVEAENYENNSLWLVSVSDAKLVMQTSEIINEYERQFIFESPSYASKTNFSEGKYRNNRITLTNFDNVFFNLNFLGAIYHYETLVAVFDRNYLCKVGVHSINDIASSFMDKKRSN